MEGAGERGRERERGGEREIRLHTTYPRTVMIKIFCRKQNTALVAYSRLTHRLYTYMYICITTW